MKKSLKGIAGKLLLTLAVCVSVNLCAGIFGPVNKTYQGNRNVYADSKAAPNDIDPYPIFIF